MRTRSVWIASACVVWLAASAAAAGATGAEKSVEVQAVDRAYQSLVAGQSRDAIAGFTQGIESRKLPPELLANALLNRALAHQNLGDHQAAIDDYSAAMRVDALTAKLRAVALYNRGLSYQKLDQPALAIEDFTSALFLDIDFAQAYYSRAEVLRRSGQYLFALNDYEQALKHKHREPHLIYYGKALTYEELQRPELAQAALNDALTASPNFQAARVKLAALANGETPQVQTAALTKPSPDTMITGSLQGIGNDIVVRKATLPAPESPPPSMLGVNEQLTATSEVAEESVDAPTETTGEVADAATEEDTAAPETTGHVVARVEPQPAAEEQIEPASANAQEAEDTGAVDASKLHGWMVQLSSQREADAAWNVWKKLSERHARLLGSQDAAVVKADLGSKGIYYRLRVHGLDSRAAAQKLCQRLKSAGASCFFGPATS
ncbi:MAG: SPOR domain-containing protein [Parvibaculaceae bacterium]